MKKEQTNVNFTDLEHQVLNFWSEQHSFEKLVDQNKAGERYRFLDGPITANNSMGIHHAWGRTLKDTFIKYHAMKGESCQYQNGFDAQGLWVEVEVEKELGFKNKQDIVAYGLDHFTDACMARVKKYSGVITEQSKRLGQWMDWDNSYYTNSDQNISAIWHFLKVCNNNGWLEQKYRVMPWCPRCGTSLSEHEMAGSYHEVTCDAVIAKLPLKGEKVKMLVWTTTPWTLTSNVALAVNPNLNYVYVKVKSDPSLLVLCESAVKLLKDDAIEIVKTVKGSELVGKVYETCFPTLDVQKFEHTIVAWDAVDATEGVGVVHIAPGCGAEDYELGLKYGLKQINPIDDSGVITSEYGEFAGKSTVEVAPLVFEKLKEQNKLYRTHKYTHSYAYCWRCKTDIVYKLVSGWYIKTQELKPRLIRAAESVTWQPEHNKKRMLDWLTNMGDWNISRKRFYGLPLPFYFCEKCGKLHIIGSREELLKKSVNPQEVQNLPHLHRPWIDNVKIKCDCGGTASRIPDVGDCWLDAGITPFSTKKYFTDKAYFNANFPSECVIEMVEQIRLWFYSLLFMSVVLEDKAPYERVMCYESVVKEDGGKFSKSGFMIKFDEAAEKIGADAIRYMYAGANIANDVRFGYALGDEARRKLLGFWNSYVFYNTYAVLDNPKLDGYQPKLSAMHITDLWLLEKTNEFVAYAAEKYAEYDTPSIVKYFETYIDDLSNWYIRINRRRFYKSKTNDQLDAYYSLYHAIKTTCQIMAPIIPFMTEHVWQNLVRETEPSEAESIHLSHFPTAHKAQRKELIADTQMVREVVSLAQKLRNDLKLKVKQPLSKMFLKCTPQYQEAVQTMAQIVKDEVNVKEIEFVGDDRKFNHKKLVLNFKIAGAVLKQNVNKMKEQLVSASENQMDQWVAEWEKGEVKTEFGTLAANLFELKLEPKAEFAVANLGNNLVVLDIELTPELVSEGIVREITREIQVGRKEAGFDIEDRIVLNISSIDEVLNKLIQSNLSTIQNEVLAVENSPIKDGFEKEITIDDKPVQIKMEKIRR